MNFVSSLKKTFSINSSTPNNSFNDASLHFARSKKAMLKELSISKENGFLIGVYSRALGEGMFLVGINDIETDHRSEIIVFETYDQSGTILNRTRISIDEIKMVCPFNKKYINPVLNRLPII